MNDKYDFRKEIDLGRLVETVLLGVFLLIGRYLKTVYLFFVKPATFSGILVEEERTQNGTLDIARPLTFLLISFVAVSGIYIAQLQIHNSNVLAANAAFIQFLLDGLKTFDLKNLFFVFSPIFLAIGLYSYMITVSASKRGYIFPFEKSIGLSSYFLGSCTHVFIIILLLTPISPYLNENGIWWILVIIYGLILRFFYCYFATLRVELKIGPKIALKIWWGGIWRFLLISYLIMIVVNPIIISLLGNITPKIEPVDDIKPNIEKELIYVPPGPRVAPPPIVEYDLDE